MRSFNFSLDEELFKVYPSIGHEFVAALHLDSQCAFDPYNTYVEAAMSHYLKLVHFGAEIKSMTFV
jgi:hypothetical protein